MQRLRPAITRPVIGLAVLMFCQLDAVAATGVSACDSRLQNSASPQLTLVDYKTDRGADSATELLAEPPAIDAKALTLTPKIDTTVLREDPAKADLKLPVDDSAESTPDAAALLLERRNARLRKLPEDDVQLEMNTALPGMDENEMLQFRDQMYRTDI